MVVVTPFNIMNLTYALDSLTNASGDPLAAILELLANGSAGDPRGRVEQVRAGV